MSKQIKVIKCPQCGNTKPLLIGNDHYRCDKCGTEFFLDNDDVNVNVNVNHRYEKKGISGTSILKIVLGAVLVGAFLIIVLLTKFCVDQVRRSNRPTPTTSYTVTERAPIEYDKYLFSTLLPVNGQGIAFYLKSKKDKTVAHFLDIITGKLIREQELASNIGKRNIEYRWFRSDSTHYVIIDDSYIFKIDPKKSIFTDVTAEICARKPALNAGLMSVSFVPEKQGEGFKIESNLGKVLYYFPKSDMLYTENAFKYMTENTSQPLLPDAGEKIYYLFLNKESAHSSNVARLFQVTYRFNNGGPENKLMQLDESKMKNLDKYRIISCQPITEERIYFSPEVLFYDDRNILIIFQPSLAKDAGINLQLLDLSGNIVWTRPFKNNAIINMGTIRTDRGFVLQNSEDHFCEISTDGQSVKTYKLP